MENDDGCAARAGADLTVVVDGDGQSVNITGTRYKFTHSTEVNVWPKSPFYKKEETEDSESKK